MDEAATVGKPTRMFYICIIWAERLVHMSHVQEIVNYVCINDLPPVIPAENIASKLGKYRTVAQQKLLVKLSLNAYTGVRGVYMDTKREIPTCFTPLLRYLNRKRNVYYPGNKDRCFHCKRKAWSGPKKRKQQKEKVRRNNNRRNNNRKVREISFRNESSITGYYRDAWGRGLPWRRRSVKSARMYQV